MVLINNELKCFPKYFLYGLVSYEPRFYFNYFLKDFTPKYL